MANDIEIAPDLGAQMFPDETTEEALARIVAQDPLKHSVTLEERRARAVRQAQRTRILSDLDADDALIVSVGGDPQEMMTGNKPRWTVSGDTIKDHLEGKEWGVVGVGAGNEKEKTTHDAATELVAEVAALVAEIASLAVPDKLPDGYDIDTITMWFYEGDYERSLLERRPPRTPRWREWMKGRLEELGFPEPTKLRSLRDYVKDHETGEVHKAPSVDSGDVTVEGGSQTVAMEQIGLDEDGRSDSGHPQCGHDFGEDPQPETPCALCGVTFEKWANS